MIELDTKHAPLMYVRCAERVTLDDIEEVLRTHESLLDSEVDHALLVDVVDAELTAEREACVVEISRWLEDHSERLDDVCRACGVVVDDTEVGRTMDVLYELRSLQVATRVFRDARAAVQWLQPIFDWTQGEPAEDEGLGASSSAPELANGSDPTDGTSESSESGWSPYRGNDRADTPIH